MGTAEKAKLTTELESRSRGVLVQSDELDELKRSNTDLSRESIFKEEEIRDLTEQLEEKKSALVRAVGRLEDEEAKAAKSAAEAKKLKSSLDKAEEREKKLKNELE